MGLEEQAALGSGGGFWTTKAVGDVPAITPRWLPILLHCNGIRR